MSDKKLKSQGFTLIEIMVVVVILSILALYVGPKIMGRPQEARINAAMMQIKSMETALKMYKLDTGVYPSTEQGLEALVQPPEVGQLTNNWKKGGYLEKGKVPKDPWGNEYIYLSPGAQNIDDFDLMSYGPDGQPGGEGENADINNWEQE
ncbi:MAG: type II secretion system major pseudopilin GspG [Deltaproteobacteria bacterium]|nr:type II secretion system major pseudopilin GspG [Deltaproteobacteria bacterium]